jgi:RHS repeat-associated protein
MENVVYNTSSNKDKFVINDAEITRITDNTNPEYQYHLKDHLGNVRLTFTSKTSSDIYTATLETNTQAVESATFRNYSRNNFDLFDHTDAGTTYTYSQLLNGGNGQQIGLSKTFAVMPGDTIKAEVYAKYRNLSSTASNLSGFALALTSAFGLSSGMTGDAAAAYNALNSYGAAIAGGSNHSEDINAPKAYLNILLFDKDYNLVDAAYKQIGINDTQTDPVVKAPHGYLYREKVVAEAGYAFVFLSNEHPTQVDVYFDDLKLTFAKSRVVQMDDYYPFGLTFNSAMRENTVANKFKFQSQEQIDDLGLNWDSFKWRNYMPDIGRFFNIDPLAEKYYYNSPYAFSENKVVAHRELEGLESEPVNPEPEKTVKVEFSGKGNVKLTYGSGDVKIGVSKEDGKISPVVEVGELPEVKQDAEKKPDAENKGAKAPNMKIVAQKDLGGPQAKSNIDLKLKMDAKIATEKTEAKYKQEQQKSQTGSGNNGQQNNNQKSDSTPKIGNGTPEKNNQDNKSTDDKQKTEQQQKVNQ